MDFKCNCATDKVFPNSCLNIFRVLAKNKPLVPTDSIALLAQGKVRHSHTIIKRRFKMDLRVKTFSKPWILISVSSNPLMPGGNKKVIVCVTFLLPPGIKGLKRSCGTTGKLRDSNSSL